MKIAFAGPASTGKTTLIKELFKDSHFNKFQMVFLTTDARRMLDTMNIKGIDSMTAEQGKIFQRSYFEKKKASEKDNTNFITDRSFVDVASYWLVRECKDNVDDASELVAEARKISKLYDFHIYFPSGIIPVESDGYRSRNLELETEIGNQMKYFLNTWNLPHISVETDVLTDRVKLVLDAISSFRNGDFAK